MSRILTLIFAILMCFPIFGQQKDSVITLPDFPHHIISKPTKDGVKLRWAPKNKSDLLAIKNQSISIYRAEIIHGGHDEYQLIAGNIAPISEDDISLILNEDPTNKNALTIAYAFYSEWETKLPGESKKNWAAAGDELDSRYLALLYACDRSFETAKMAGLGFLDQNANAAKSYAYRLVIEGEKHLMAHTVIQPELNSGFLLEIDRWEEGEGKVTIAWNRKINEKHYSGYFIERSADGNAFTRLNKEPYVHVLSDNVEDVNYIAYIDSVKNYTPYFYRVVGLDAFGDESLPSETVKLHGRDRTPPEPPLANPVMMSEDQLAMNISWTYEKDLEEISRFLIKKSNSINGKYTLLDEVSKDVMSYSDKSPSLLIDQYYQICAVDTADNFACTYPKYGILQDRIPPSSPQNLTGSIDSNGVVSIKWDIGPEIDLYGYKVHVANGANRPYSPITSKPIRDLKFSDTLDLLTMTEYIYYKVSAIDLRQNASKYSEVLRLKKPDLVPPTAAIFSKFEVKKERIHFELRPSQSGDIERHNIERSIDGLHFITHAQLEKDARTYIDESIEAETTYWYRLVAIDDDGNMTYSPKTIKLRSLNPNKKLQVMLSGEKTEEGFLLKWNKLPEIDKTRIYRTIGKNFITYFIQESPDNVFLDKSYVDQNYKVKVYFKDGSTSTISEALFTETNN